MCLRERARFQEWCRSVQGVVHFLSGGEIRKVHFSFPERQDELRISCFELHSSLTSSPFSTPPFPTLKFLSFSQDLVLPHCRRLALYLLRHPLQHFSVNKLLQFHWPYSASQNSAASGLIQLSGCFLKFSAPGRLHCDTLNLV